MKKIYLILAVLTSVMLFSCTSDEFAGNNSPTAEDTTPQAISFAGGSSAITRGNIYGAAAAAKLGNTFVVYGTKHTPAENETADRDNVVFNNFQVKWKTGTAGSSASNTSDWDYLGLQAYDATPTSQGIKYWDYSYISHTFYAFSYHDDASGISYPKDATNDKVVVTKTTSDATSLYNKGYAVTVKTDAVLNNLYFSDRLEVPKAQYDKTVSLTFRNIGAKVRFGFYETIPGYTVKIDKFYIDGDASAAITSFADMNVGKDDGYFYAALQNVNRTVDQTLDVTYYDNTDATIENRPKLTNPAAGYLYNLKTGLGSGLVGTTLATTSSNPTWDNGGAYTPVFPFEANTNPLLLKLDFTLTADDGSPDVIQVKGARAIVPAQFVQWKSNFAYTYIFKISDKTNGTTGDVDANDDPITDPEGLKPITFDAIVVDMEDELQQTISSVSTRSITTYAEGAIVNEYYVGKSIYTVISTKTTGGVITPSAIGSAATEAQVYKLSQAATEAEVFAKLTGSPIKGLTLTALTTPAATIESTVPLADGTTPSIANVKFTPSATGYYAYVYTTTAYVAPSYLNQASGAYDSSKTYYMKTDNGAYYAVAVTSAAAFDEHKAQLYIIDPDNAGTPGVYDVKIIKVQ